MFRSRRYSFATLYSSLSSTSPRLVSLSERRHRDVALDVLDEVETVGLAVLGRVGDAVLDRLGDRARLDLLAAHEDPARDARAVAVAEQAHRELGAPGAHEAGDADDLAGAHVDRDVVDHDAGGVLRVVRRPVLDAQQLLADVRLVVGVAVLEIAADHVA